MLKKFVILLLLCSYLFASDFWQLGFQQGTFIYNIENSKKEKLSFECGYSSASIYLYNKGNEVNLKEDEPISFIINDEKKLLSAKSVSSSGGTDSDNRAWGNLVSEIPSAKKIIVESNNKKFLFEPSNLKELNGFTKSCLEYENDTSNTQNNTPPINSNPPSTSNLDSELVNLSLEEKFNRAYGYSYYSLNITSLTNNLKIEKVEINKGVCQNSIRPNIIVVNNSLHSTDGTFPETINEYENLELEVAKSCNILRIDIFTNRGIITKQKR